MQIVWFKRDLRVQDHAALSAASQRGPVLPLYIVEPELWQQEDSSARHWAFIAESLHGLRADLARLGQPLVVRQGDAVSVLREIVTAHGATALWSHEETGNDWTYQRDLKVGAWCRDAGIAWHELRQNGVHRRLASRNGWATTWDRIMAEPQAKAPALAPLDCTPGAIPTARDLDLAPDPCPERQPGGRARAEACLKSFLTRRAEPYRWAMSSPLEGARACSRLSPHLAWGTLSLREVTQATWQRQTDPDLSRNWRQSLRSFVGRLHWHCHFIQKLEDEPRIEYENMHRAYDGLRPSAPDSARLEAWAMGETGLPFVDACMRCLNATGWLNFRMRAMVMSVASYHLWLDWRAPGLVLARRFTDYEPGIHWSQVQMQSGTTGINTPRIYNPVKQGKDQDPTGAFTRKWVPELAAIDDRHLQEPWKAENASAVLGKTYPHPIIDHLSAARSARDQIWAVRRSGSFRQEAKGILSKHASRKTSRRSPRKTRKAAVRDDTQLSFPFES
ncbi:deoxyribodipyrimidine photo-lyase [Rhodobacteraceae bacterium R_SAG7]|nr:deoxyribodipyrimidine photo-lyase [Rhodobacteraceae bacterium R_SAG7]